MISLAFHPHGKLCASGETGGRPLVTVWDNDSRKTVSTLTGYHANGVNRLCFSKCGSILATCGLDDHYSLALYDWKQNALIGSAPTGNQPILGICFIPLIKPRHQHSHHEASHSSSSRKRHASKETEDKDNSGGGWSFATCGPSLIFWTMTRSGALSSQRAVWGKIVPSTVNNCAL